MSSEVICLSPLLRLIC